MARPLNEVLRIEKKENTYKQDYNGELQSEKYGFNKCVDILDEWQMDEEKLGQLLWAIEYLESEDSPIHYMSDIDINHIWINLSPLSKELFICRAKEVIKFADKWLLRKDPKCPQS